MKHWKIGDKVKINLQTIKDGSKSIKVYPSEEFVNRISKFKDYIGVVSHTFAPSYDATVTFEGYHSFHVKGNWIKTVEE